MQRNFRHYRLSLLLVFVCALSGCYHWTSEKYTADGNPSIWAQEGGEWIEAERTLPNAPLDFGLYLVGTNETSASGGPPFAVRCFLRLHSYDAYTIEIESLELLNPLGERIDLFGQLPSAAHQFLAREGSEPQMDYADIFTPHMLELRGENWDRVSIVASVVYWSNRDQIKHARTVRFDYKRSLQSGTNAIGP